MSEQKQNAWSLLVGGLIGYGFSAKLNPTLTGHGLPAIPDYLSTAVGMVALEQAAQAVRHLQDKRKRAEAINELRRIESSASTVRNETVSTVLSLDSAALPQAAVVFNKAEELRERAEAARVECERGEFDADKIQQIVKELRTQHVDLLQSITFGIR